MTLEFLKCLALSIFLAIGALTNTTAQQTVVENFNNISSIANSIHFENQLEINNNGGHLQGIQFLNWDQNEYAFISGSSDLHAYCTVIRLGSKNEVISVNKLMKKPFKHAGGIQVFQNYLAIGIEDNAKKNVSKVCIYNISPPDNPILEPIAVIDRRGKAMRSTAGCVGFTKYKNKALLAVGDWDTKNLDFYRVDFDSIGEAEFKIFASINTQKASRKGWIDKNWESYQNINLFAFNENELYLIGLGQNKHGEDIADLFRLEEKKPDIFSLTKLASKTFECKDENNFKAGAGVYLSEFGKFHIYSCKYHISGNSTLNHFANTGE